MNFDIISFTIGFLFCAGISIIKLWGILKGKKTLTDKETRAICSNLREIQERHTEDSEQYTFYEKLIIKLEEKQ